MKAFTNAALAALVVGAMATSGMMPAQAQDAAPAAATPAAPAVPANPARPGYPGGWQHGMWSHPGRPGGIGHGGMGQGSMAQSGMDQRPAAARHAGNFDILNLACSGRGTEFLEIAFIRARYEVKPTAEQQPLFAALQTAAIADQKTFAETCRTARKDGAGNTMLDKLQTELALDNAKVTALSDVLPKFKAFYDSLTDQQKARLEPHHGRQGPHGGNSQWHRPGNNRPMPHPDTPSPKAPAKVPMAPDPEAVPNT